MACCKNDRHGDRDRLPRGDHTARASPHTHGAASVLWQHLFVDDTWVPENQHADQWHAGMRGRCDGLLGAYPAGTALPSIDAQHGLLAALPAQHTETTDAGGTDVARESGDFPHLRAVCVAE